MDTSWNTSRLDATRHQFRSARTGITVYYIIKSRCGGGCKNYGCTPRVLYTVGKRILRRVEQWKNHVDITSLANLIPYFMFAYYGGQKSRCAGGCKKYWFTPIVLYTVGKRISRRVEQWKNHVDSISLQNLIPYFMFAHWSTTHFWKKPMCWGMQKMLTYPHSVIYRWKENFKASWMVKKSAPYLSPFENNGGSNFRKFVLPSVRHICISSGENLKMGGW